MEPSGHIPMRGIISCARTKSENLRRRRGNFNGNLEKMVDHHGDGAFWAAAALGLLSLCALISGSGAVRPSDHGLAFQKNTTGAEAAAMAAFFRGDGGGGAHPEARNATGAWAARATPLAVDGGRNRMRTVLLTVAAACGAAGVALLAGAAIVYLVQTRRETARRRRGSAAASCVSAGTCERRV